MAVENDDPSSALVRAVEEEVAPDVGRFMGTIAGSPSFEIGEMVAGHFRYLRFKQGVKQMQKAQKLLDDAGLEPAQVPMRTLVPLIEGGSAEDDSSMSERWAALLANAAAKTLDVPPSFPQVLSQLEPVEAHVLDKLYEVARRLNPWHRTEAFVPPSVFQNLTENLDFHCECLVRLGLIKAEGYMGLTRFGLAFVRACRPPTESDTVIPDPAKGPGGMDVVMNNVFGDDYKYGSSGA